MTQRLAVYGLLRRDESMASFLAAAAFVGEACIEGYDLYHLGGFPGAVSGAGSIVVEVYELDDAEMLALLDEAEGVDEEPPVYRRVEIEALGTPAWMYVFARDPGAKQIPSGDWLTR